MEKMKLKELCKAKNILRMTIDDLAEVRNNLDTFEDKMAFSVAVEKTGKYRAVYNFFELVGKDNKLYPAASLHQDKKLFECSETKEIKALAFTGPMLEYKSTNRIYKCKAGNGMVYSRASFVKFEENGEANEKG